MNKSLITNRICVARTRHVIFPNMTVDKEMVNIYLRKYYERNWC